jgi:uncharacterized protein (TIGR02271 family)
MPHTEQDLEPNLKPLSEVSNYTVEKGDPDPRGFTVVGPDGRQLGTVDDLIIDTAAMKVRYLVVKKSGTEAHRADTTDSILLPVADVEVRSSSEQVIARRFTGNERSWMRTSVGSASDQDRARLTRSEEELQVGKREVSKGEARVSKHVETEHVSQPVTRRHEEAFIERRPVEAGARGDASISEDELRIPLKEEELVVDKRAAVKEELVVGKRMVEERDTVEADLRREEFDIENTGKSGSRERDKPYEH